MKELTPYQIAALDFSMHISLTANAGSGKTFVLSRRFVEIALNGGAPLNSIVAITFTDKAAGELNRKIANEIDERIANEKNRFILRRLEKLRSELVFANISTIHSFCINILKEFSPEAGIDADFAPIDKNTSDELIDLSIQETLKEGFKNSGKINVFKRLIRFFGSKDNFNKQVKSVIKERKNILHLYDSVYSGEAEDIADYYNSLFDADFRALFLGRLKKAPEKFRRINNAALEINPSCAKALLIHSILSECKPTNDIFHLYEYFGRLSAQAFTKEGKVGSKGYLSKDRELLQEEIEFLQKLFVELKNFDSIFDPSAAQSLSLFAKHFASVIVEINERYELKKRRKGYLDFEDLLIKTRDILKLNNVKEYLGGKYKFIMVDEYQDTNEIQYEIIMPLLDNLNTGNLCVVGDEKQSIYMFRDADIEVFSRTKEKISGIKKEENLLTLPHSFRLAPRIALFINSIFSRIFADPEPMFNEVSHSELYCAREGGEKGNIEFILCGGDGEQNEGELTARKIIELYNERRIISKFSDILILCRKRNSFKELEEAFAGHKIPFAVVAGKGFYQKQTTLDVYNYLSFLLNKDNDAALLGILRSPFYSLSDTELLAVSLCEGNNFFEKLNNYSSLNKNALRITAKLNQHLNETNSYSFPSLIRKILDDTSYWAVISESASAKQEIANLEKLIATARNYSMQGYKTLYDFVEFLKDAIEMLEDEGQAEFIDNSDSVKIMTVHQAKGLEAKAVFLFNANEKERDNSIKAKTASIDKKYGIVAKVPPGDNYFEKYVTPPIAGLYNYIIKKKNEAETKRLLYVALTRAADYLCVVSSHKNFEFEKGSLADYLFNSLGQKINNLPVKISGGLTYLLKINDRFEKKVFNEEIIIPVLENIELQEFNYNSGGDAIGKIEILTGEISKREKNEFISASKISVFTQCPVKYYLTYEIGFAKLYKRMRTLKENYEFNRKEDEQSSYLADLRGLIIHSVLEKDLPPEKIEDFVKETIDKSTAADVSEKKSYQKVEKTIIEDLKRYYSSGTYLKLKSYLRYKNEFEVYAAEKDYFLYGIVDKIVYDNEKIIIIDYKTDSVKKEEISGRAESYFNQLMFYAYSVSKSMKKEYQYELWIVFIKHPEETVKRSCTLQEIEKYRDGLEIIIPKIRDNIFVKNLSHCSRCHLSGADNNCIYNENVYEKF